MRYFKDPQGRFFGVDADQDHLIQSNWVPASQAEIDRSNQPTPEQQRISRIFQLKQNLFNSDFKVLPDYDKPNDDIKAQRKAWRDELRRLGA